MAIRVPCCYAKTSDSRLTRLLPLQNNKTMDSPFLNDIRRIVRPGFLVVAFSAWLGGCADMAGIAPHAHPIEPASLQTGRGIEDAVEPSVHWPAAKWWTVYGDPQLDTLVENAAAGSPTLGVAAARLAQVQALAGIVRSSSQVPLT